jgi:tRNA dimethylallyltransferase
MKKLVVVLGPTAIGKTAFSIELAKSLQTEIISCDSRQFFKELNIGVARPNDEELSAVPHHFIAHQTIENLYSAGDFEKDALALLESLFLEKDIVVCAGGSGLYLDALLKGFDDMPSDLGVRDQLNQEASEKGIEVISERLKQLDPEHWSIIDTSNRQRVIRALEVCLVTGKKFSELRSGQNKSRNFQTVKIGLSSDREWLYDRINRRVDIMLQNGLLEEARGLMELRHLNALNTVGYKELFEYFDGDISLEDAVRLIKQHTRNYAKRQITWWNKDESIKWQRVDLSTNPLRNVIELINS